MEPLTLPALDRTGKTMLAESLLRRSLPGTVVHKKKAPKRGNLQGPSCDVEVGRNEPYEAKRSTEAPKAKTPRRLPKHFLGAF